MSILEQYTPAAKEFVLKHLNGNVSELALKSHGKNDFPMAFVLDQIKCRQKLKLKVPEWYDHPDLIFPNSIIGEQCSSTLTAQYKSSIISGSTFVDLTGGLGVDTYFLSKKFKSGVYVEPDIDKLECVKHNFGVLEVDNIIFVHSTAEEYLEGLQFNHDLIYIDPSRRVETKKVIGLEGSIPDVTKLNLEKWANVVIIKTSPIMDVALASNSLNCVKEIHAVSIKNDCKEVLYYLEEGFEGLVKKCAINYNYSEWNKYESLNKSSSNRLSMPLNYIYEPNSSMMKLGLFNNISDDLKVFKLHSNTHLFTSKKLIDFPGRTFELKEIVNYDRKSVAKVLNSNKANISTRNFSDSVDQIRKKLKLKDGGVDYLFATTLMDNKKVILVCKKK